MALQVIPSQSNSNSPKFSTIPEEKSQQLLSKITSTSTYSIYLVSFVITVGSLYLIKRNMRNRISWTATIRNNLEEAPSTRGL